jgi:hypothetical protein
MPLGRCGAFVRGEAQPLRALKNRFVLRQHTGRRGVARSRDGYRVEAGVGIHRSVEVAAPLCGGEVRVRGAHLVEIGCRQVRHRHTDGKRVHRRHDGLRVADGRRVDRCDDGRAPGTARTSPPARVRAAPRERACG